MPRTACTTTSPVPCRCASAKATVTATASASTFSTPSTTGPSSGTTPATPRTTATGHLAAVHTDSAVECRRMSSYRSPPPMATTRSWASAAASASAGAACPATQAVEISASGQVCSAVVRAE